MKDQDNSASTDSTSGGVQLSSGTIINDTYKVVSLIGRGGMGAVYRVHQEALGKDFALKVLDLHQSSDVAVRRFQQEARTASQLQHPNLVEVHDFGVFRADQPFLVMDLVEGVSLSDILRKKGSLPTDFVIGLCIQICFGLMYAHEMGVVHRDIKPGNIMLLHPDENSREGTVKIVDFGIAKLVQSESGEIQTLTKTGEIFGSPLYMSPEQCKGDPVDKRSDIYSLGCVIFECLTGSPPFFGDSAMSTMMKRLSEAPVSLKEGSLGRDFPLGLENVVRKMLAVDPNERYQDLGAVIKDLISMQSAGVDTTQDKTPETENQRDRMREFVVLMGVLALLSCVCTFAVDAYVIFPNKVKKDLALIELEELQAAYGERPLVELKKSKEEQKRAKVVEANIATLSLRKTLGQQDLQYPYLHTKTVRGSRREYLSFPFKIGVVSINFEYPGRPAFGNIELPPNAVIVLKLDKRPSAQPELLKNLTAQTFALIQYGSTPAVTNETIAILEHIPKLFAVKLEGSDVDTLKPLYGNKVLKGIELLNSLVPVSEILKLERLRELEYLSFGPADNPTPVFNELARTNKINNVHFKLGLPSKDANNKYIKQFDVSTLARITHLKTLGVESAASFTDEDLEKLTPLKNLEIMVFRNTGITPKSIHTFKKFPKLQAVTISRDHWSDADLAALRKVVKVVTVTGSREDMRDGMNKAWPNLENTLRTDPRF